MFQYILSRHTVVLQGSVDKLLCLIISPTLEKHPRIGIEIGGIARFCHDSRVAHLLSLVQAFVFQTQKVGIVIETTHLSRIPMQTGIIGSKSCVGIARFVQQIAHDHVAISHQCGVVGLVHILQTFL